MRQLFTDTVAGNEEEQLIVLIKSTSCDSINRIIWSRCVLARDQGLHLCVMNNKVENETPSVLLVDRSRDNHLTINGSCSSTMIIVVNILGNTEGLYRKFMSCWSFLSQNIPSEEQNKLS